MVGNPKRMGLGDLSKIIDDSGFQIDEILVGETSAISLLGMEWADQHNIPWHCYKPQVGKYRRLAYMMRDRSMVGAADGLILIWDGNDSKSRNLCFLARQSGLKVYEQIIENP